MNCLENIFFPDDDPQLLLNYELTELIKFIAWICQNDMEEGWSAYVFFNDIQLLCLSSMRTAWPGGFHSIV